MTGNAIGSASQNKVNGTNLQINRENNAFNAAEAEKQRNWQESMWNKNNEYNSPSAMISRGLNPYIGSSVGAGVSKSPASGGAAASAATSPSMQAYKPNFSSVFQSLASLAQAKASEASAGESGARARQAEYKASPIGNGSSKIKFTADTYGVVMGIYRCTPSRPTLSIAVATNSPISSSPLADNVATCLICFPVTISGFNTTFYLCCIC